MTISRRTRGILVSMAGAFLGGSVACLVTVLIVSGPSSDAPNGWWDDPDGWLVLLIPPATILGMAIGTNAALRLRCFDKRSRTVGLVLLFSLFALILLAFGWVGPFRLILGYPGSWLGLDVSVALLNGADAVFALLAATALARGVADRRRSEPASVQGA